MPKLVIPMLQKSMLMTRWIILMRKSLPIWRCYVLAPRLLLPSVDIVRKLWRKWQSRHGR